MKRHSILFKTLIGLLGLSAVLSLSASAHGPETHIERGLCTEEAVLDYWENNKDLCDPDNPPNITGGITKEEYPNGLCYPSFNNYIDAAISQGKGLDPYRTSNALFEDEKDFLKIGINPGTGGFDPAIFEERSPHVDENDTVEFIVYIHNDGDPCLNENIEYDRKTDLNTTSKNTRLNIENLFKKVDGKWQSNFNTGITIWAYIWSDNAINAYGRNEETFNTAVLFPEGSGNEFTLEYVENSAVYVEKTQEEDVEYWWRNYRISNADADKLFSSEGMPLTTRKDIEGNFKGGGGDFYASEPYIALVRFQAKVKKPEVEAPVCTSISGINQSLETINGEEYSRLWVQDILDPSVTQGTVEFSDGQVPEGLQLTWTTTSGQFYLMGPAGQTTTQNYQLPIYYKGSGQVTVTVAPPYDTGKAAACTKSITLQQNVCTNLAVSIDMDHPVDVSGHPLYPEDRPAHKISVDSLTFSDEIPQGMRLRWTTDDPNGSFWLKNNAEDAEYDYYRPVTKNQSVAVSYQTDVYYVGERTVTVSLDVEDQSKIDPLGKCYDNIFISPTSEKNICESLTADVDEENPIQINGNTAYKITADLNFEQEGYPEGTRLQWVSSDHNGKFYNSSRQNITQINSLGVPYVYTAPGVSVYYVGLGPVVVISDNPDSEIANRGVCNYTVKMPVEEIPVCKELKVNHNKEIRVGTVSTFQAQAYDENGEIFDDTVTYWVEDEEGYFYTQKPTFAMSNPSEFIFEWINPFLVNPTTTFLLYDVLTPVIIETGFFDDVMYYDGSNTDTDDTDGVETPSVERPTDRDDIRTRGDDLNTQPGTSGPTGNRETNSPDNTDDDNQFDNRFEGYSMFDYLGDLSLDYYSGALDSINLPSQDLFLEVPGPVITPPDARSTQILDIDRGTFQIGQNNLFGTFGQAAVVNYRNIEKAQISPSEISAVSGFTPLVQPGMRAVTVNSGQLVYFYAQKPGTIFVESTHAPQCHREFKIIGEKEIPPACFALLVDHPEPFYEDTLGSFTVRAVDTEGNDFNQPITVSIEAGHGFIYRVKPSGHTEADPDSYVDEGASEMHLSPLMLGQIYRPHESVGIIFDLYFNDRPPTLGETNNLFPSNNSRTVVPFPILPSLSVTVNPGDTVYILATTAGEDVIHITTAGTDNPKCERSFDIVPRPVAPKVCAVSNLIVYDYQEYLRDPNHAKPVDCLEEGTYFMETRSYERINNNNREIPAHTVNVRWTTTDPNGVFLEPERFLEVADMRPTAGIGEYIGPSNIIYKGAGSVTAKVIAIDGINVPANTPCIDTINACVVPPPEKKICESIRVVVDPSPFDPTKTTKIYVTEGEFGDFKGTFRFEATNANAPVTGKFSAPASADDLNPPSLGDSGNNPASFTITQVANGITYQGGAAGDTIYINAEGDLKGTNCNYILTSTVPEELVKCIDLSIIEPSGSWTEDDFTDNDEQRFKISVSTNPSGYVSNLEYVWTVLRGDANWPEDGITDKNSNNPLVNFLDIDSLDDSIKVQVYARDAETNKIFKNASGDQICIATKTLEVEEDEEEFNPEIEKSVYDTDDNDWRSIINISGKDEDGDFQNEDDEFVRYLAEFDPDGAKSAEIWEEEMKNDGVIESQNLDGRLEFDSMIIAVEVNEKYDVDGNKDDKRVVYRSENFEEDELRVDGKDLGDFEDYDEFDDEEDGQKFFEDTYDCKENENDFCLETKFDDIEDDFKAGDIDEALRFRNTDQVDRIYIIYIFGNNTVITERKCKLLEPPDCGETFDNEIKFNAWENDDFKGDKEEGEDDARVVVICPFFLTRQSGDVLFHTEIDVGVDVESCSVVSSSGGTVTRPSPVPIQRSPGTGPGDTGEFTFEAPTHDICKLSNTEDVDIAEYTNIFKNFSSAICEMQADVAETWTETYINEAISANIEKISRWGTQPATESLTDMGEVASIFGSNASSGVFVFEGDVTIGEIDGEFKIYGTDALPAAQTYIVKNGTLTINSDIIYDDSGAEATDPTSLPSAAFIVLDGNIEIAASVEQIDAVIMAVGLNEGGEIKALGNETSYLTLTINGSLIGNVYNLFEQRKGVGDPTKDEGSITVRYDERILLNTPPGLSDLIDVNQLRVAN